MTFADYAETRRTEVEAALARHLPAPPAVPAVVADAMRYSLMAGGKRLRPLLVLAAAARRRITVTQGRFGGLAARLEGLSPLAVLGRGYAVTWDAARTRIIRDAATLRAGDDVVVTLARGGFEATVKRSLIPDP